MQSKKCQICEAVLIRRKTEANRRFVRRRFCSNQCSGKDKSIPIVERFWKHVRKTETGCWLWTGFCSPKGYGKIRADELGQQQSHRVSYMLVRGLTYLSPDVMVCHSCDNPPCVNPEHLFLGDAFTNMQDMIGKGRANYKPARGSKNGNNVFIESEIAELRKISDCLIAGGMKKTPAAERIARAYNRNVGTVRSVVNRKTWQHVI